ncbi:MAG: hypothetical protein HFH70_06615 [Lachnospiraceae bacterium]|nr:hypothetical protein [Lachnospiraceae bacterium]
MGKSASPVCLKHPMGALSWKETKHLSPSGFVAAAGGGWQMEGIADYGTGKGGIVIFCGGSW